jgi:hypothetical protein
MRTISHRKGIPVKAFQAVVGVMLVWLVAAVAAQQQQGDFQHSAFRVLAPVRLPDEPLVLDTAEQHKIRIVGVAGPTPSACVIVLCVAPKINRASPAIGYCPTGY